MTDILETGGGGKLPLSTRRDAATLSFVNDGRETLGFILARGKLGFEAFDREERSLGLYPTAGAAANAVVAATENERAAG
jgi:hypothetical protein